MGLQTRQYSDHIFITGLGITGTRQLQRMPCSFELTVLTYNIVIIRTYFDDQVLDSCLGVQFADRQHFGITIVSHKHFHTVEQTPVERNSGTQSIRTGIIGPSVFSVGDHFTIGNRLFLGSIDTDSRKKRPVIQVIFSLPLLIADNFDRIIRFQRPGDTTIQCNFNLGRRKPWNKK